MGGELKSCFSQPSRTASWGRLWDGLCGTLGNARICAKTKGNHHVGRSRQGVRRRPGAFVGRPGASWVRLGASWGRLGGSSARLEPSWGRPGTSWRPLGGRPGSSWVVLGPAWAVQGRPGAVLGPSWGRPGAVLGVVGASWGHLGPVLGSLDAVLGRFGWNPWELMKMCKNLREIINYGGPGGVLEASWGHLEGSGGENMAQGGWKRGWDR